MLQKRLQAVSFCLGVLAWACVNASGHTDPAEPGLIRISETLEVRPLEENLWVHTSYHTLSNGQVFPGNGLLVRNEHGLVLVDTAWGGDNTRDLMSWVENHLGEPLSGALVTHFHSDSAGGAAVLAEAGTPVFVSRMTWELLDADIRDKVQVVDGLDQRGSHQVQLGVELFYGGPGHSADNLFAWLPHERTLFGTCAVRSPVYPGQGNTSDASPGEWAGTIERARDRYPSVRAVVPGHGPVGDSMLLEHTINLFSQEPSTNESN